MKLWRESAKFWTPHPLAPTLWGPHPPGSHPSGLPLFLGLGPSPFGPQTFGFPPLGARHDTPDWPNGLAKIGLAKIGFGQNQDGQTRIGQSWSLPCQLVQRIVHMHISIHFSTCPIQQQQENCPDLRDMKVTKFTKKIGKTLLPAHRSTQQVCQSVQQDCGLSEEFGRALGGLQDVRIASAAPDEVTLQEESRALQRLAAGPYAFSTPMLMAGTEIGLCVDVRGIHVISFAARLTVETLSGTLADGPANIQGARGSTLATLHALSTEWDDTMLHRSMAYAAMSAHDFANRLDRSGGLQRIPTHKMQASATALLCEHEQQRDFARAIAARASNIFWPISSHRLTQVLVTTRTASRATHPGLVVGFVLCNGVCTPRRFHTDIDDGDLFCRQLVNLHMNQKAVEEIKKHIICFFETAAPQTPQR